MDVAEPKVGRVVGRQYGLFSKLWALLVIDYMTARNFYGYQNETPFFGNYMVAGRLEQSTSQLEADKYTMNMVRLTATSWSTVA